MLPINPLNRNTRINELTPLKKKGKSGNSETVNPLTYIVSRDNVDEMQYVEHAAEHPESNFLKDQDLLYRKLSLGKTLYAIHDPEAFKRADSQLQAASEIVSSYDGQITFNKNGL